VSQGRSKELGKQIMAFELEKKFGLHGWFKRNKGTGWINCKTGGSCGRSDSSKGSYPACRPTKSMCNSAAKKKKSSARISWKNRKGIGGRG